MAIYARCNKCRKDNPVTSKTCKSCGEKLGSKYLVKIKETTTGKWRTKITPSLKMAREVEVKFKTLKIENELFNKKQNNRFSFDAYLTHAKLNKKSWKDDRNRWARYISNRNHNSPTGIQTILAEHSHLSPQTQRHILNLIRRVYNWHIEQGLWHDLNPCRSIKIPKFDNRVSNPLDKKQLNTLITYLKNWDNRRASLVIQFALYTGRRKGEILNLTWDDTSVSFITCKNTKNGETLSFPLNQRAKAILAEAKRLKISKYVFPSSSGHHYKAGLSLAWSRLRKRLKRDGILDLTGVRFHDLRHTYASHLASSGSVDIYTLKTLLGHKDIKLTERYSHLSNERLRTSTEVLDDNLSTCT